MQDRQNGNMEQQQPEEETIEVLYVPRNPKVRQGVIRSGIHNLSTIAVRSRKDGRVPDGDEFQRRFKSARMFLDWMAADLEITPEIKRMHGLDKSLETAFDRPDMHFPEDIREKARALHRRWTEENWGAAAVVEEDEDDEGGREEADGSDGGDAPPPATQIALPSRTDPVFGQGGMLHGVLKTRGPKGGVAYAINPSVPRADCKVFGHNGLAPGAWFPLQMVALARGAHGAKVAGIAGDTALGAYSIVVSSKYEDLDRDRGGVLYYSGSSSHANADPRAPAPSSTGTRALKASWRTQNPVRVLRSGGPASRNRWAPDRGIRYDGLYHVVNMLTPINTRGGMYEQFKLRRLEGQPPLEEICRTSPTPQQKFDWERIQQGS